jgi:hypothetical protein
MPVPDDNRCLFTTIDEMVDADAETRCTLEVGHEGMHDDGCIRWWDPIPREVWSVRWRKLADTVERFARQETSAHNHEEGMRIAEELRRLA